MKWFKHMSDAHRDLKLMALIDEFGMEGYGMWWMLCEVVAEQYKTSGEPGIETSMKGWRKLTGIYPTKFKKLIVFLYLQELISLPEIDKGREKVGKRSGKDEDLFKTFFEKPFKVCIPKMAKLKDNYTKDLQATGNSTRARTSEAEAEVDNNTLPAVGQIDLLKEPEKGRDGTPVVFKVDLVDGTQANVTEKTIQEWEKNFRFVDVRGKVANLVEWYRSGTGVDKRLNRKNWFFAFAGMLQKSSEKAKADMVARNPGFDPNDPHGDEAARKAIEQSWERVGNALGDRPF